MTLPNFLVIGAMRCGTTLLDQILRKNSDIYLPQKCKEVHFFDRYYERGIEWYEGFFPSTALASNYQAIGEITPAYIYFPQIPSLIHKTIPECKLIALLRNPADRAYSQYQRRGLLLGEFRESFEESLINEKYDIFNRGLYAEQLKRYLDYFPRKNLLILNFESMIKNPQDAKNKIAEFLCLNPKNFEDVNMEKKFNKSYSAKFARSYALTYKVSRWLRKNDIDWAVNLAKSLGVPKLFGEKSISTPKMALETRKKLLLRYEADICQLETLIDMDFSSWRE